MSWNDLVAGGPAQSSGKGFADLVTNYSPTDLAKLPQGTPYTPPAPAPPPQSIVSQALSFGKNVVGGAKDVWGDLVNVGTAPIPAPDTNSTFSEKTPTVGGNIALTSLNSYAKSLKDAGVAMSNFSAVSKDKSSTGLQKTVAGGQAVLGGLGAFFAPVSAAGAGAAQIPVLGHVAQAINNLFGVIGSGGSDTTEGALQALPYVSQSTKDQLQPLVKEVGSLAAQIVAGKVGDDLHTSFAGKSKELTAKLADAVSSDVSAHPMFNASPVEGALPEKLAATAPRPLPVYGDTTLRPLPVTGDSVDQSVPIANDYRTITPDIQAGSVAKDSSGLPIIKADSPSNTKLGDLTIEPIRDAQPDLQMAVVKLNEAVKAGDTVAAKTQLADIKSKVADITQKITPAEEPAAAVSPKESDAMAPEGKTASGIGKSIEAKAVEEGLTKRFKNVAGYDSSTLPEQSKIFADTVNEKGFDEVRSILRGEKPLPEGQKSFPFIVAAEDYIKAHPEVNKDGEVSYELANSVHTGASSESASNLSLGQNRTQDSFTAAAQEVKKARETKAGEKAVAKAKSVPKEAKKAMSAVNLSEEDLGKLESFIDKITC